MWTPSYNGDARVGSLGRRCRGWSPKDSYLRGRERKATITGGQGQSERRKRRTRETSILTDRLVYGISVGCGARVKLIDLGGGCSLLHASAFPSVKLALSFKFTCLL